jgi:predicted unusual protein kinase regulating ubiquinone biosynthesis (AarF/ABC1/UbiB family)
VCSALDPKFNLWDSVEPYAAQLLRDEGGNVAKDAARQALEIAATAARLPKRLDGIITRFEDGSVSVQSPALERRVARLERSAHRLVSALLFGGFLIAGVLLRVEDVVLGTLLMVASILPLVHTLFASRRG